MATELQRTANRANALKSTGPKTVKGKAKSKLNAVTHGATAHTLVLPGEDAARLKLLRTAIEKDCAPANALESELVEQLVQIAWRARRISTFEKAMLHWLHVQEERTDDFREEMNSWKPMSPFDRQRHPEEGMIPSYAIGPERESYELGRVLSVAMDKDFLGKLSRYEAHLLRQFKQLRGDIEAAKEKRKASPKKSHSA